MTDATIPASPTRAQVLSHLDEVLISPSFSSSKRSQEFLRYVVCETLDGRANLIKERNIALEVFGKRPDFESGEDASVRVKAREVRQRLTDYYRSSPDTPIRIEMPVGSYIPRVQTITEPAPPITGQAPAAGLILPAEKKSVNRRRLIWWLGGSLAAIGATSTVMLSHYHGSPLDRLWRPIFATREPLIIFLPILLEDGVPSTRVGIGPTVAVSRAASFLSDWRCPYRLRFGPDLTFSQLRQQPSLLLGGSGSSIWTTEMTRGLRFQFKHGAESIVDIQTNQQWSPRGEKPGGYVDEDYGIVCRLFDPNSSGQIVLIAAGVTTFGTESAAEYLFDPSLFSQLMRNAPNDWEKKSFEAVIHTSIIGTTPGKPNVVATHFW